ncbi:MAG: DUF4912 domain-containing protein [Candidatus Omnitrophota bacterium]|nr:DUF4912 domain-containing protein [Candidatus Omnitrophota bacterium]
MKNRLKKQVSKKSAAKRPVKISRVAAPAAAAKKEIPGTQQIIIEQAKFSHPQGYPARRTELQELPRQYGADKIILQVRDPWWLHTYWELNKQTIEKFESELKAEFNRSRRALRVYDVSNIIFNGSNAHRFFDIPVPEFADNWYIDTGGPGRSWCVDLGLLLPDGRFITILRSNTVSTPLDGPSWITDEEWMIPDDMFARLYGMGFGLGRSSAVGKAWQERVRKAVLSSPGITSGASAVKRLPKERKFWLTVNCELIVYGATEADAKVTVQGRPIALRKDGTFTLRFNLPDGKQVIPVVAVSKDRQEERGVTPIVIRETR